MSAALVPAMIPEQLSVPTAETEEPASEGDAFDLRVIVAGDAALKEHLLQADKAFATWLMERDAEYLRSLVESAEGEYGIDYQHLLTRSQQAGSAPSRARVPADDEDFESFGSFARRCTMGAASSKDSPRTPSSAAIEENKMRWSKTNPILGVTLDEASLSELNSVAPVPSKQLTVNPIAAAAAAEGAMPMAEPVMRSPTQSMSTMNPLMSKAQGEVQLAEQHSLG